MQFIQFGMLGALGALAIPIIIHLMFRQRARLVDLGTLQFLKIVLRDNARRRRLEALAPPGAADGVPGPDRLPVRPAVHARDRAGHGRPSGRGAARPIGQHGTRRWHPADRSRAGRSTGDPGAGRHGDATGSRHASTERSIPFPGRPTSSKTAIEPTAGGTDYGAAMAWARDLLVRSRKAIKELHILTDLQRSGLDRGESVSLPADVEVHLRDFGRAFPKNVAVTGVTIAPQTLRPGESVSVTATVLNASPLPISKCPVRLHVEAGDQKRDLERTVDLDGGATASVAFSARRDARGTLARARRGVSRR